jgi:hypothetical protein
MAKTSGYWCPVICSPYLYRDASISCRAVSKLTPDVISPSPESTVSFYGYGMARTSGYRCPVIGSPYLYQCRKPHYNIIDGAISTTFKSPESAVSSYGYGVTRTSGYNRCPVISIPYLLRDASSYRTVSKQTVNVSPRSSPTPESAVSFYGYGMAKTSGYWCPIICSPYLYRGASSSCRAVSKLTPVVISPSPESTVSFYS